MKGARFASLSERNVGREMFLVAAPFSILVQIVQTGRKRTAFFTSVRRGVSFSNLRFNQQSSWTGVGV